MITSRRPLIVAVLISTLLHAAVIFLVGAVANQPRGLALTKKGGKIQAIFVSTARPFSNRLSLREEPQPPERVTYIDAPQGSSMNRTSSAKKTEASNTPTTPNSDVFLPQEYLTRQPSPKSTLSLEDIPQPGQPGVFQMRIWINQRGEAVHTETDETTAPAIFVEQITERFKATRFIPGERHGIPVASIIRIEISY